jgi:hypothetical protein
MFSRHLSGSAPNFSSCALAVMAPATNITVSDINPLCFIVFFNWVLFIVSFILIVFPFNEPSVIERESESEVPVVLQ